MVHLSPPASLSARLRWRSNERLLRRVARAYDQAVIVAAVVQFYFQHFVPIDETWPEVFAIDDDDYRVNIEPRRADDELFPEEVDRTLSTTEMRLVPLHRPGGIIRVRVADRILDRIKATVVKHDVERGNDGLLADELDGHELHRLLRPARAVFEARLARGPLGV